jgi:hypothetical protein
VDKKKAGVQLPADLASLSDDQLAALLTEVHGEFDSQIDSEDGDPDARLARATELADMNDTIVAEQSTRAETAAAREEQANALKSRMHPEPEVVEESEAVEGELVDAGAAVTAGATTRARGQDLSKRLLAGEQLPAAKRKLNPTLAEIQAQQARDKSGLRRMNSSVLVASADIPNVAQGSQLADMDALVAAIQHRARTLPISNKGLDAPWYPVASMQREHRFMLDRMVDIPTVGINRGGMRWPTSASYGDIVSSYWSWNEAQDIAAVTGTAQSGTKTCVRVPCPSYNEERLHCDGFCLTVGNLMEDAFPENIANYTRLLFAGHAHRLNTLRINALVAGSGTAITGYGAAGAGLVAPVLGSLELTAIDYREKYRMCEDAVLEVILPRWLRGAMRSDLRKRTGMDLDALAVTDAQLMNMFDLLNIRVQWVTDWQVGTAGFPGGSTPLVVWPTTVQFMMFSAGTFVLGRGLQLNLGVIRDSVLNATNDHTAEWLEECWLLAKIGHESRLGTIAICPDGTTGAADLTACGV